MRYTTKDLLEVSKTSLQSINKLFKSNSELKELAKEHKIIENRNVYYDEVIYEWFCRRYDKKSSPLIENGVVEDNIINEDEKILKYTPLETMREDEELKKVKEELEDIKEKYAELQDKLDKIEAERKQLLEQNGNLLLLLSQEKAEKQKLLPQPRISIGERIKKLFGK